MLTASGWMQQAGWQLSHCNRMARHAQCAVSHLQQGLLEGRHVLCWCGAALLFGIHLGEHDGKRDLQGVKAEGGVGYCCVAGQGS